MIRGGRGEREWDAFSMSLVLRLQWENWVWVPSGTFDPNPLCLAPSDLHGAVCGHNLNVWKGGMVKWKNKTKSLFLHPLNLDLAVCFGQNDISKVTQAESLKVYVQLTIALFTAGNPFTNVTQTWPSPLGCETMWSQTSQISKFQPCKLRFPNTWVRPSWAINHQLKEPSQSQKWVALSY